MPLPLPSTFMPLPLAIMIPFMGIQSSVMARQFGMNFQYGKRKISSMSNEEFNKLTPAQMQADFARETKDMIPTFGESLKDMRPFQRMIWVEMLAVMKEAIELGIDVAKAGVDPLAHIFGQHIHGTGPGGSISSPPVIDEHKFLSPSQILQHKKHGHLGGVDKPVPSKVEEEEFEQPKIPPPSKNKKNATSREKALRILYIKAIDKHGKLWKDHKSHGHEGHAKSQHFMMLQAQQKLVNLYSEYNF